MWMEHINYVTFPKNNITQLVSFQLYLNIIKTLNMQTNKILGIILVIASLTLGYFGINKVSDSSAEVKVLGLEINASNESEKQEGFIYLGLAILLFAGGIKMLTKKGIE
jgi:NhaP-type Na+/H+ or K+/H+ antiporter